MITSVVRASAVGRLKWEFAIEMKRRIFFGLRRFQPAASHDGMEFATHAGRGLYPSSTGCFLKGFAMLAFANVLAPIRSGLAQWSFLSRVAVALLLGALAVEEEARAAVVIGPGGHFPFGATSQWEANGKVESALGTAGWRLADVSSGTVATGTSVSDVNETVEVDIYNLAETMYGGSAAPKLKAASALQFKDMGSGQLSVRGWSSAIINDLVLVKPLSGGALTSGLLSFNWRVDGDLNFQMESVFGSPLNQPHGVKWAHYVKAMTFVTYTDPFTGDIVHEEQTIGEKSRVGGASPMTQDQEGGLEYLRNSFDPDPQTLRGVIHLGPVPTYQDSQHYGYNSGFSNLVNGPVGFPIPVMIGLFTMYNGVIEVEDFGALNGNIEARFENTAELVGVSLYNPDGSPYTEPWTLESSNGIDYNEVAPVPEPSTYAMALAGLACGGSVVFRRRKRA